MNWRKNVSREHDYHDQVQQVVSKTMQAHGLGNEKLQAILTDLLEEMNRITLKIVDDHELAQNYIHVLVLMHYQHLVLIYCVERCKVLYSWHELPTDKRGHDAAIHYLEELSKGWARVSGH